MNHSKLKVFIFVALNLFLSVFFIDYRATANPTSRVVSVLALSEQRTWQIDAYQNWTNDKSLVNHHYYSDKAPLPTIITYLGYQAFKFFNLDFGDYKNFKGFSIFILGTILTAIIPWLIILRLSAANSVNVQLTLLAYFGSFLFIYAGSFFNHILSGMFLLLGFILHNSKQHYKIVLSGLCIGLALLCEYPLGITLLIFSGHTLLVEKNISKVTYFILGSLPALLFLAYFNWITTGQPWVTLNAYHADPQFQQVHTNYGFRYPTLTALWGLSFSSYRGLFFYCPALLAGCFLLKENLNKNLFKNKLFLFNIGYFLLIATHFTWWGGWCYGPRYLSALTIVNLYYLLGHSKLRHRQSFYYRITLALSTIGLAAVLMAKLTHLYMLSESYQNPLVEKIIPSFLALQLDKQNIFSYFFGINPIWVLLLWLAVFVTALNVNYETSV